MGEGRGHFTQGGYPRDVNEFALQFLQPRLGMLAFGEIADEAGEEPLPVGLHFADGEFERKVDPSRRSPTTTRPLPMMRRSPVW
jgi:hypothetical protein